MANIIDRSVGAFPVKGKICVVTGGGSGINLHFVRQAHEAGARVLIADLRLTDEAKSLVESTQEVMFQETDVTKRDHLNRLIRVSDAHFGDVPDIYVAGAGIFEPPRLNFWDDEEDDRYLEVDVNAVHPIKLTRVAMRALVSHNKKGVVLIVGSSSALMGIYSGPLYCASKHALAGFTKSMGPADRLEGVKILLLCPGDADTPIWTPDKIERFGEGEKMTPDYVAQHMIKLVESGEVTGGTIFEVPVGAKPKVVPAWHYNPSPACAGAVELNQDVAVGKVSLPKVFEHMKSIMDLERGKAKL
ncbi:MAG: hypothetical protein M1828_004187 [Chrysothrix sp. TS-e1954]|nr:MAG: hypothetical protein M1828_004187 [Chrysothrix sp. TS-e1954]